MYLDDLIARFDAARKDYLERFNQEPPMPKPRDMEKMIKNMRDAIEDGEPLPQLPEGVLT